MMPLMNLGGGAAAPSFLGGVMLCLLVAACGNAGQSAGTPQTGQEPDDPMSMQGTAGNGPASDPTSVMPLPMPSECSVTPGHVVLQRLTRSEYNRSVRDLFAVTSNPADNFPPDSSTAGFDNNAESLTISPQLTELLLDAAELVAGEALVNDRDAIFICDPTIVGNDVCARDILSALALRVQRRPPTMQELDSLMTLMTFAADEGDSFETGIGYALQALLMSPQFLYRGIPAEGTLPQAAGTIVPLDDYALASRLSYFLWGSTPDAVLLQGAADGALGDVAGRRAQFDRLLADPKSDALYQGFVSQWLQLGKLLSATPDPVRFPQFTEELRTQMGEEVRLFFEDLRQRDGSALELISGTRTFANDALAAIYGLPAVGGEALVPVTTDASQRAGVLTMPALLTMTSGPEQPNIVRRGVWLLENVLCSEPPPPPDGIPPAPTALQGETERERLERHRADPSCASCHALIDPLGFAFENYDALGSWRDSLDGDPIDNQGTLPDGRTFAGIVELVTLLQASGDFGSCLSEKLATYALGRQVSAEEHCLMAAIGEQTVTVDAQFSDLLWAIVDSDAFTQRETPEAAP